MSMIQVENPRTDNIPKTYLAVNQAATVGTLYVDNTTGFSANWAVQVGETNEEQSEVILIGAGAPSGTKIVLAADTAFEHPADTPVYAIKWNQVVFEKSATGTAGTAAAITNGTVTIQPDQDYTQFDDTSSASTDAYRTRFRNSALVTQTSESDWMTPAGPTFYSQASIRNRIKDKVWNADYLTDDMVNDWINEWKDIMSNSVISVNEDYALGTVDVGFGTAGLGTITTTDFSQVRRVWVTGDGVDWYQSNKMNINDFQPDEIFVSTHPYHAWQGDTVFQVKPDGSAGTARLTFYRFGTTMVNDTDELPQPMRSYTDSFVSYGEAQALKKDKNPDWKNVLATANVGKQDFVSKLAPRDKSGPRYIDLTEHITGDSGGI